MKKQGKLIAIVLVLLAFVVFFMTRPVREKACPLQQNLELTDEACRNLGGVLKNGSCTCPDGSAAT